MPDQATNVHCCPEPDCDRRFNRKYTLLEHMKTHTGEKPHECPMRSCGKRFSTSGNLSRHKRLHGFIEPLPCPVPGCLSAFPSANKLEKHMKFHRGDAVHVCTIDNCGKTFSTTGNLNRHIKNHHPGVSSSPTPSQSTLANVEDEPSFTELLEGASAFEGQVGEPTSVMADAWHPSDMVDELTEIFGEQVVHAGHEDEAASAKVSILDDMISFHVTHMQ